jgi:hypothetical protein
MKAKVLKKPYLDLNKRTGFTQHTLVSSLLDAHGEYMLGDFTKQNGIAYENAFNLEKIIKTVRDEIKAPMDEDLEQTLSNLYDTYHSFSEVSKKISSLANSDNKIKSKDWEINPAGNHKKAHSRAQRMARSYALKELKALEARISCDKRDGLYVMPQYKEKMHEFIDAAKEVISTKRQVITPKQYAHKMIHNVETAQESALANTEKIYTERLRQIKEFHPKDMDEKIKELEQTKTYIMRELESFNDTCESIKGRYGELEIALGKINNPIDEINAVRTCSGNKLVELRESLPSKRIINMTKYGNYGFDKCLDATVRTLESCFSRNVASLSSNYKRNDVILNTGTGCVAAKAPLSRLNKSYKVLDEIWGEIRKADSTLITETGTADKYMDQKLAGYVAAYVFHDKLMEDKGLLRKTNNQIIKEYIQPIIDTGYNLTRLDGAILPVFKEAVLQNYTEGMFSNSVKKKDFKSRMDIYAQKSAPTA